MGRKSEKKKEKSKDKEVTRKLFVLIFTNFYFLKQKQEWKLLDVQQIVSKMKKFKKHQSAECFQSGQVMMFSFARTRKTGSVFFAFFHTIQIQRKSYHLTSIPNAWPQNTKHRHWKSVTKQFIKARALSLEPGCSKEER